MRYVFKDVSGNEYVFFNPKSVILEKEEGVPADSLTVLLLSDMDTPEFSEASVFDGESCIFRGIVDEQLEALSEDGTVLEISARGLAALLLDNEAMPRSCHLPNMQLFMDRNFSRLGFREYIGNDRPKSGSMTIEKGTSEWSVLKRYCERFLGVYPRITADGIIDISGGKGETLVLSGEGEHKIISLSRSRKRCELISEYRVRTDRGGGYEMYIENEKAKSLGVNAVRYLNMVDGGEAGLASCYESIEKSNRLYDTFKLTVSGRLSANIGDYIILSGEKPGSLRITGLIYKLSDSGEETVLSLSHEE